MSDFRSAQAFWCRCNRSEADQLESFIRATIRGDAAIKIQVAHSRGNHRITLFNVPMTIVENIHAWALNNS